MHLRWWRATTLAWTSRLRNEAFGLLSTHGLVFHGTSAGLHLLFDCATQGKKTGCLASGSVHESLEERRPWDLLG